MGDYSTLATGTSVHCASSDYRDCSLDLPSVPEDERFGQTEKVVTIGKYVTVGSHSCILPHSIVPDGVALGAYTMIKGTTLLEPFHLYVGVPCRDLGKRKNQERIREKLGITS